MFLRISILSLLLSSCASGPKSEKKSSLNYLSGDHYQSDVTAGSIPLSVKRVRKNTTLSGKCFFKQGDGFKYPVKFVRINILEDGRTLGSTTTDGSGNFTLSSYLENGAYQLSVDSKKYRGSIPVKVEKYEYKGLELVVKKQN